MQLMALNALLLFDAIFIFFLFLVSVSCLLYYLPLVPPSRTPLTRSASSSDDNEAEGDVEQGYGCDGGRDIDGAGGGHTSRGTSTNTATVAEIRRLMAMAAAVEEAEAVAEDARRMLEAEEESIIENFDVESALVTTTATTTSKKSSSCNSCCSSSSSSVANPRGHLYHHHYHPSYKYQHQNHHHGHNDSTCSNNYPSSPYTSINGNNSIPDDPATHIIMPLPQGNHKKGRREKGQPFAPIETV